MPTSPLARVIHGDALEKLRELDADSIDAVVTDPPYELGFMGKAWDKSGIANNVQLWREVLRVLKPGGHLLSFGGTRTYHRMASAIEDAGFEIRDCAFWCYGSGFPKSLNVGKAVEAQQTKGSSSPTAQRKAAMGENYEATPLAGTPGYGTTGNFSKKDTGNPGLELTTEDAKKWEGWGTALKPAVEPIVLARKPLAEKSVAAQVLKTGTGALNIDASRIGTDKVSVHNAPKGTFAGGEAGRGSDTTSYTEHTGRWPANLILSHNADCELVGETTDRIVTSKGASGFAGGYQKGDGAQAKPVTSEVYACTEGCAVAELDRQSGQSKSTTHVWANKLPTNSTQVMPTANTKPPVPTDSGGASRFFYVAKPNAKERPVAQDGTRHSTVKPLKLMEYLVRLTCPPGGTVLDPFAGSGTTLEAAERLGFKSIGIELTAEYLPLIQQRLERVRTAQVAKAPALFDIEGEE